MSSTSSEKRWKRDRCVGSLANWFCGQIELTNWHAYHWRTSVTRDRTSELSEYPFCQFVCSDIRSDDHLLMNTTDCGEKTVVYCSEQSRRLPNPFLGNEKAFRVLISLVMALLQCSTSQQMAIGQWHTHTIPIDKHGFVTSSVALARGNETKFHSVLAQTASEKWQNQLVGLLANLNKLIDEIVGHSRLAICDGDVAKRATATTKTTTSSTDTGQGLICSFAQVSLTNQVS